LKLPEDRPSVGAEIGSVFSSLLEAFDASARRRAVLFAEIEPQHNVLALGFDTELLEALLRGKEGGVVGGIDDAKTVERAQRGLAEQVSSGRLDVLEGEPASIPFGANFFERALCIERFETWPDPAAALREVLRVLADSGILVVALRKPGRRIDKKEAAQLNALAKEANPGEALIGLLRECGYIKCKLLEERYVLAYKPFPF
jgi:ubiquinone/menaquinone biosynthesis C-methylase UbiE